MRLKQGAFLSSAFGTIQSAIRNTIGASIRKAVGSAPLEKRSVIGAASNTSNIVNAKPTAVTRTTVRHSERTSSSRAIISAPPIPESYSRLAS